MVCYCSERYYNVIYINIYIICTSLVIKIIIYDNYVTLMFIFESPFNHI